MKILKKGIVFQWSGKRKRKCKKLEIELEMRKEKNCFSFKQVFLKKEREKCQKNIFLGEIEK